MEKKMEGEEEVKLLGFVLSSYAHRVIFSLELKGIPYKYIEEDIYDKSQLLLESNPVHKKIPVLLHRGRAIAESTVILEYIEETWPEKKPLMPTDPYQRALARFWIKFADDMTSSFKSYLLTIGEEQEKAAEEARGILRVVEEKCLGDKRFFGGDSVGLIDLAFGWVAYCLEATEEAAGGEKLMDPHALPRLSSWAQAFKEVPVVKRNLPSQCSHDKFVAHLVRLREKKLGSGPKCG